MRKLLGTNFILLILAVIFLLWSVVYFFYEMTIEDLFDSELIAAGIIISIFLFGLGLFRLYAEVKKSEGLQKELSQAYQELAERHKIIEEQLKASEEDANYLADVLPQIIWKTDNEGHAIYFNQVWYKFTGMNEQDSLGSGWLKAVHPDDQEETLSTWQQSIAESQKFQVEYRLRKHDGRYCWFLSIGIPKRNAQGAIEKWYGSCTDIEDQKNLNAFLENKVEERTSELKKANEELKRSNEELENFAYIASHDLQEPLRKIRAFGDMLAKKHANSLPEKAREYISRMQNASMRMQKLIDDLLNYSRVSRNFYDDMRPVNLKELVEEVLENMEAVVTDNDATISYNGLPTITGNRRQMSQLFQNLISNGIKFHKPDQRPVIKINSRQINSETLKTKYGLSSTHPHYELEVSDNGIGFKEKYLDKIFTIFQRLHGRFEYQGTGIGLAICRKVVENHHGVITAQSTPEEGSKFIIVIPE
ncbi:MAG: sensor histidine kinase [Candidatus Cyclobacteriaceae bacterium M3_2C_046]